MQRKHLVVALSVVVVGCGVETTSPSTLGAPGSLTFAYTSVIGTGTYFATGAAPADRAWNFGSTPWAVAKRDNVNQSIDASASVPTTNATWDYTIVRVSRATVGSNTISNPLNRGCTALCTSVTILFGSTQTAATAQLVCFLSSGTVALTSVSDTHAVGTFSGRGSCVNQAGTSTSVFTVTNGTFDVDIVS